MKLKNEGFTICDLGQIYAFMFLIIMSHCKFHSELHITVLSREFFRKTCDCEFQISSRDFQVNFS